MPKIFQTVVKKVVQVAANAVPTFIYNIAHKRSDGIRIPNLKFSDTKSLSESINIKALRLNETKSLLDQYRIPNASIKLNETHSLQDSGKLTQLRVSDQSSKKDSTTFGIVFQSPGTTQYTIPPGVNSIKIEAWGAGGGGGATGVTFGGGGGKGGAYARRNAQTVAPGQVLNITVAPDANGNGQTSSVSFSGGETVYTTSPSSVSTTNNFYSAARNILLRKSASGAISVVASASGVQQNDGSQELYVVTIPASTQIGNLILIVTSTQVNRLPAGYTYITTPNIGESIMYKFAQAGDAGSTVAVGSAGESFSSYVVACLVYRNASEIIDQGEVSRSNGSLASFPGQSSAFEFTQVAVLIGDQRIDGSAVTATWTPTGQTQRITLQGTGNGVGDTDKTIYIGDVNSVLAPSVLVQAAGGNAGSPGVATGGGAGATAQNGTSIGDVTFTGGNGTAGGLTVGGDGGGAAGSQGNATGRTGRAELGGDGGGGATLIGPGSAALNFGGGGGGNGTLGVGSNGAQGAVRITFTV